MSRAPEKYRADPNRNQHFGRGIAVEQLRGPRARHPKGDGIRAAVS
jgi:hypothetical protein